MANYNNYFGGSLGSLESLGLTDVILPFFLIFVIIFAILQKTKVLGEDKRNFNSVVALVMGLVFVIPHVTGQYAEWGMNPDPVNILNQFLPGISLLVVAVVMLFILIGLWGGDANWVGGTPSAMIAILAAVAVIWIFGAAAGWWNGWTTFNNFFGAEVVQLIIIILVFGIIIWFITKSDHGTHAESFLDKFGNMFKK